MNYKYNFYVADNEDEDYIWQVIDIDTNKIVMEFNENVIDVDPVIAKQFYDLNPERHIKWLYPNMIRLLNLS